VIQNQLLEIWRQGEAVVNAWLHIPHSYSAEVISRTGFDAVTCDMQHGLVDYTALLTMFTAISTTAAVPLARVPGLDPALIGRILDAGALGVICPMINTPEDAGLLVSSCRYAPQGRRSFGPNRASFLGADYVNDANQIVVPFAMIETAQALQNLDLILSTEGMRAVYVGPADLALSLGCTPKVDPTERVVIDAIEHIVQRARSKNVIAGIHTGSAQGAQKMIDKGYQLVTLSSDRVMLETMARKMLGEMRESLGRGSPARRLNADQTPADSY
jgi:4-hydroxy-2-oxoheptanedioate aldolase